MTSITYYFILFLKRCPSLSQRIEVTGLFCALYAIGLHGFGSYPFNVLSILILFGVFLARFHEQSVDGLVDHITIVPSKYCSRFMFNVLVILLASILLWKNILTQASHYYFFRGRHAFLTGDFSSAEHDFNIASAFQNSESVERTRGILMTTILQTLVDNTSEQAKQVFEYATSDFQHAIAYNPYDAKTRYLMGKLYVSYPALAGDDYAGIAAAQFKLGMQVDPGNFLNFYEYGKLLVSENKSLAALRVLEKGTQYAFPLDDRADDYFALLAKLKRDNKDTTRVKLWAQRRIPPGG